MTKLKQMLLAGTLVPALAFPVVSATAQTPDDRRPHGQHPESGGPRGEHAGHPDAKPGGANRGAENPAPHRQAQEPRKAQEPRQAQEPHANPNRAAPAERAQNRDERRRDAGDNGPGNNRRHAGDEQGAPRHAGGDDKSANPGGASQPKRAQNRDEGAPGHRNDNGRRNDDQAAPRHADDNRGRPAGDRQPERAQNRDDNARGRNDNARRNDQDQGAPRRADDNRNDRGRRDVGDRDRGNEAPRGRDDGRNDNARGNGDRDPRRFGNDDRRNDDRRGGPGAPGGNRNGGPTVVIENGGPGGFLPPTGARRLDDIRRDRREVREGDRLVIREPGRSIIQQGGRAFIVHDENARFRELGLNARRDRRGNEFVDTVVRPGGIQIITYTDVTGRMLRRVRRGPDGREVILIDNGTGGRVQRYEDDVVTLAPPPLRIPRDRYVVDYRGAQAGLLYDTLIAPPLAAPPRRYTLDQIRYSPDVRNYVRSIDINTINFDSGSWDVPAAATGQLEALGGAIKRALDRNPNSVFLIEGYTDATGNPDDNLSLSDRRAQSVAEILSKDFGVPPENLTTQGYGQQNLKEPTDGPSAANRRVVVRNITQLLASGGEPPPGQ